MEYRMGSRLSGKRRVKTEMDVRYPDVLQYSARILPSTMPSKQQLRYLQKSRKIAVKDSYSIVHVTARTVLFTCGGCQQQLLKLPENCEIL